MVGNLRIGFMVATNLHSLAIYDSNQFYPTTIGGYIVASN